MSYGLISVDMFYKDKRVIRINSVQTKQIAEYWVKNLLNGDQATLKDIYRLTLEDKSQVTVLGQELVIKPPASTRISFNV